GRQPRPAVRDRAGCVSRRAVSRRRGEDRADRGPREGHSASQGRVSLVRRPRAARNERQGPLPAASLAGCRGYAVGPGGPRHCGVRAKRPQCGFRRRGGPSGGGAGRRRPAGGLVRGQPRRSASRHSGGGQRRRPPAWRRQGHRAVEERMPNPIVQIRGLSKAYRRDSMQIPVLRDITLEVPEGEFLGLMGPSGSGKTTLLNLIAGIDRPDAGSVLVAGTDVTTLSESQLARWRATHIGFVFQFYNLIPVLSAFEKVELPMMLTSLFYMGRKKHVRATFGIEGPARRVHRS